MTYAAYIFLVSFCVSNILSSDVLRGLPVEGTPPKKIEEVKAVKNNKDADMTLIIPKNEDADMTLIIPKIESNMKGSRKKELKPTVFNDINNPMQNNSNVHTPEESSSIDSFKSPNIGSAAMVRGVLVFAGIGLLFLIYVGCKTYRRKKPNIIIRKYGVRTRRSDVEMTPLPLDEDEEDETLFDLGSLNRT